jgi:chromosome segregation ATPase
MPASAPPRSISKGPERLQRELDDLQGQLRELTVPNAAAASLAAVRARRAALNKQISRAEKALEEALELLGHRRAGIAALRAAG